MSELLKVKNLSVTFSSYRGDGKAVRNVSFTVQHGEILALVGESGCGKSVTAKAIMWLLDRTSAMISEGSVIEYGGENLLTLKKRQINLIRGKDISMVFQDAMASLNPTMTIGAQITETIRTHLKLGKAEAAKRARNLLAMVELPEPSEQMRRYPHQLSGGQRQRVMIAMALSCDPKLLIADEPTTALDVTIQAQILSLLQKLQKQLGMSVLLITHDLGIVAGAADRVHVMYCGQIIERGTTSEIFSEPMHPYTAALLTAIPKRSMERRSKLYTLPGATPDLRLELNCCPFAARCRYAMPVCKKQMPKEVVSGHSVSCWLMDERAPKVSLTGGAENE
ncbi:MAG: ABC transporter ATP-binding protein [Oscillospiraceae bacterium]|nr:ABC transporter ATP-binding protein [Oscillospiraceae bacterium]